jgi:sugar phosphate isomerase/epimerase
MKIYPKTCRNFVGLDNLMPYAKKYKGVELQFFEENGKMQPFDFKTVVEKLMEKVPELEEVIIHPPLSYYDIECIIAKDISILENQLRTMVELSRKYNIKVNMVYHTLIDFESHKALTLNKIAELLKIIEGENVKILLENIFMFFEDKCTVYQIADYFDNPNLKVCFDICHLHCRANINKQDVYEYAAKYLDKDLCKKYTYQVHFSYTVNNDGYVDHKTHGRGHQNIEDVKKDLDILKEYNMLDCNNFVTEVSEDDYSKRKDQIKDIEFLEELNF